MVYNMCMKAYSVNAPWSEGAESVLQLLETSERGLTSAEAKRRFDAFGSNEIEQEKPTPGWLIFLRQYTSPLVLILIVASFLALALGERTETILIIIMVFLSGLLSFVQEYRSERALRQLKKKLTPSRPPPWPRVLS